MFICCQLGHLCEFMLANSSCSVSHAQLPCRHSTHRIKYTNILELSTGFKGIDVSVGGSIQFGSSGDILASLTLLNQVSSASIRCTFYCRELAGRMGGSQICISFKVTSLSRAQNGVIILCIVSRVESYMTTRGILLGTEPFWN